MKYIETRTGSGSNVLTNSGVVQSPSVTKNNTTGVLTVGEGRYRLYHTTDFTGIVTEHTIPGGDFTIPNDNVAHRLIADYNNGNPILKLGTLADVNDSSSLSIASVVFNPLFGISLVTYGTEGIGLLSKLSVKGYLVSRFNKVDGFSVAVENTRQIVVTGGNIYIGSDRQYKAEVHSGTDKCVLMVSDGSGSRTESVITQYSNTVYDNGTATLQTLTDGHYGVLWVWRSMSDLKLIDVAYGMASYATSDAAKSATLPTNIPTIISDNALLLGKLVYQKGSNTAEFVDNSTGTTGSTVTSHAGLSGLLGGKDGIYYHSDQPINKTDDVTFNVIKSTGDLVVANNKQIKFFNAAGDEVGIVWLDSTNTMRLLSAGNSLHINPDNTQATYINYNNSFPVQIGNGNSLTNLYIPNGRVGIGTTTPARHVEVNGDAQINGYTMLGSDAPLIKQKLFTGTFASTPNTETFVSTGIASTRVVGICVTALNVDNSLISQQFASTTDANWFRYWMGGNGDIGVGTGQSATAIYGRPYKILLTYMA